MTPIFRRPPGPHLGPDVRPQREVAHNAERAATSASGSAIAAEYGLQATHDASAQVESPRMLERALATTFGGAIARSVMSELGLDAVSERPLTACEVNAAAAACATSMSAMSGLNFVSQLLLSARKDSPEFRECAGSLGIDAHSLSDKNRSAIDLAFGREMALASSGGRRCVDMRDAGVLMQRAISAIVLGADKHEAS